jgi:hypothetical protein
VERLLYRIGHSSRADRFVLKGAMLFRLWTGALHRPTQDVDLLGYGSPDPDQLASEFAALLRETDDPTDGMVFDHAAISAHEIREGQEYMGVRVHIPATLGTARLSVQVDVGFGDAATPEPKEETFPTLLQHEPPRIRAYARETSVAEKLHAICAFGLANSRMKDYYDLLIMSRRFSFDGSTLVRALRATFERRGAPIPATLPIGLTEAFAEEALKQTQWSAFLRRSGAADAPEELVALVHIVGRFIGEPLEAASSGAEFKLQWDADSGWVQS